MRPPSGDGVPTGNLFRSGKQGTWGRAPTGTTLLRRPAIREAPAPSFLPSTWVCYWAHSRRIVNLYCDSRQSARCSSTLDRPRKVLITG